MALKNQPFGGRAVEILGAEAFAEAKREITSWSGYAPTPLVPLAGPGWGFQPRPLADGVLLRWRQFLSLEVPSDRALPANDWPGRTRCPQSALVTAIKSQQQGGCGCGGKHTALPLTRAHHSLPEAVQG